MRMPPGMKWSPGGARNNYVDIHLNPASALDAHANFIFFQRPVSSMDPDGHGHLRIATGHFKHPLDGE